MTNFKVLIEPFSIFTYVCAKFHNSIPLLGKYCLFQKSKLLYTRDVISTSHAHTVYSGDMYNNTSHVHTVYSGDMYNNIPEASLLIFHSQSEK